MRGYDDGIVSPCLPLLFFCDGKIPTPQQKIERGNPAIPTGTGDIGGTLNKKALSPLSLDIIYNKYYIYLSIFSE